LAAPAPHNAPFSDDGRPAVSVVVPFRDTAAQLEELLTALGRVRLAPSDEVIIADNTPEGIAVSRPLPPPVRAVRAIGEASCARARNAGAAASRGEWLLFVDADCRPDPGLVEAYRAEPLAAECGIVAGAVRADPAQRSVAATWARTRRVLDERLTLAHPFMPNPIGANHLVRRATWQQLGGYLEGITSGEDVDFSWRAQRAGWTLAYRPQARVAHTHRVRIGGLLRQTRRHAGGDSWVRRRWGLLPAPASVEAVRAVVRAALAAPVFAATGQLARARLKLLDGAVAVARQHGARASIRAARPETSRGEGRPIQLWCDAFPVLSETFVVGEARALATLGHDVEVVAWSRPVRPTCGAHDVDARWIEDDTPGERRRALLRLVLRHPLRCAADVARRRAWRRQEYVVPLRMLAPAILGVDPARRPVLHAHFAKGAALNAMRAARIAGVPWTLTAHAYDIYAEPANLAVKLRDAELVTSGCDRTVEYLRGIAGPRRDRVVKIVMGVDAERFQRRRPPAGGRTVLAVGRLVEKKGLEHLLRAAALPELRSVAERVVIAGDGPLRAELERLVRELRLDDLVELRGACEPHEVPMLLEDCTVLAVPSVVAVDGDRDSMPLVAKEALAMEVPVVCSDLMGLPEVVRPGWGRLVPPGDSAALAAALRELLRLDVATRAEMGRAGREFVVEFADVHRETARLAALLAEVSAPAAARRAGETTPH
jgi:colanic acid/amylovoran biosynthesis glycosyltransferase